MSEKRILEMIDRSCSKLNTADEALKWSQAACNAANALRVLEDIKSIVVVEEYDCR